MRHVELYHKNLAQQFADGRGAPVNAKQAYAASFSGNKTKANVATTSARSMAEKGRNQRVRVGGELPGGTSPMAVPVSPVGGTSPTSAEPGAVVGGVSPTDL